jgi:hypothetical protein
VDLNELLKSAPHLQGIVTTIVAGVPFAEIVKRIVVPSADALGERMKNRVERCFAKTAKMIEDAGITPQPVEDKLVVEILRGASLESDETLHDMWSALLANAASPETASKVRPSFPVILRQMAPHEALVLNLIDQEAESPVTAENEFRRSGLDLETLSKATAENSSTPRTPEEALRANLQSSADVLLSLDALMAQQLVEKTYWKHDGGGVFSIVEVPVGSRDYTFTLTHRGRSFIGAVNPPAPKK